MKQTYVSLHSPPHLVLYVRSVPCKTSNDFYGIQHSVKNQVWRFWRHSACRLRWLCCLDWAVQLQANMHALDVQWTGRECGVGN